MKRAVLSGVMTKKIKRTENFEIVVEIKTEDFIRPPREAQRNALLNSALNEFSDNLQALHKSAARFVPGKRGISLGDRTQKICPTRRSWKSGEFR